MVFVPDNLYAFDQYVSERSRNERMRRRIAHEWGEDEEDLPFVDTPDDYGSHSDLY